MTPVANASPPQKRDAAAGNSPDNLSPYIPTGSQSASETGIGSLNRLTAAIVEEVAQTCEGRGASTCIHGTRVVLDKATKHVYVVHVQACYCS